MTWEFEETPDKYDLLVGQRLENEKPDAVKEILIEKEQLAHEIAAKLEITSGQIGAEVGVGCGFMSKVFSTYCRKLFCVDISESFLGEAQNHCEDIENIDFKLIGRSDWSYTHENSLDFIACHNVVIHFPLYELYWFLKQANRLLKPDGRLYFDFLSSDRIDFTAPGDFHRMFELFHTSDQDTRTLFHYHSEKMMTHILEQSGFETLDFLSYPNENCALYLSKRENSLL